MSDTDTRIALVTGANRGLGLETVRQLRAAGLSVWLAARDADSGKEAAKGVGAKFVRLDVTDSQSISAAVSRVRDDSGRLDVLVNNAGIAMEGFNLGVAKGTLATNLYGPIAVTDAMLPIMPDGAAIVMVSSGMGSLDSFSSGLGSRFREERISRDDLDSLMAEFVAAVEDGSFANEGWPGAAYSVSKAGLNVHTRILARELEDRRFIVNAVCPGWVRTDMGGADASRSLAEGGRSIVWAALLSGAEAPTGGFFRDGDSISW